jgi:tRNA nucleotidyltransferase (CCA-adding enzyme)
MQNMDPAALYVLDQLEQAGFEAYLVGGCVRDRLMDLQPADYDVATDAHPNEVQKLFPRTAATGIQHGTVAVLHQGKMIEVTTYRTEGNYVSHRRPSQVTFVSSLREDLARRDFTINAMAEDRNGQLVDPFGGQADLQGGWIRAVGDAAQRFTEDALRMLRAVRFAAQLDFRIHPDTATAFAACVPLMRHLAVERVTSELDKMWRTAWPSRGVEQMFRNGFFRHLPPFSQWEKEPQARADLIQGLDAERDSDVRWALWMALFSIPSDQLWPRLRSLRLSTKRASRVQTLLELARKWPLPLEETQGKQMILQHGLSTVKQVCRTSRWIKGWSCSTANEQMFRIEKWAKEMPVHHSRELAIDGKQLVEAVGISPGPWVGEVLQKLMIAAALGRLPNEREALLKEGKRLGKQYT